MHRAPIHRYGPALPTWALLAIVLLGHAAGFAGPADAQEVLTNEAVIALVRAGLSEAVVIQKIRMSQQKFDTSADALIKLRESGVSDSVIASMLGGPAVGTAPTPPSPGVISTVPVEPIILHVSSTGEKNLKSLVGTMQIKSEPFAGTRQEVVLLAPKAEYRIADRQPTFVSPHALHEWVLARLKPGKNDRNLPINKGEGWYPFANYVTRTFQVGVDPKYVVKVTPERRNEGIRLVLAEPLKPGEYGFVAVTRGQPNLVEVFDFGVD